MSGKEALASMANEGHELKEEKRAVIGLLNFDLYLCT